MPRVGGVWTGELRPAGTEVTDRSYIVTAGNQTWVLLHEQPVLLAPESSFQPNNYFFFLLRTLYLGSRAIFEMSHFSDSVFLSSLCILDVNALSDV